ncbi:hypothetical protein [Hungatella effluvii]|uniref:hypothetical protein n=1 Tax=Hungatella effluvii TaxID=1096246 RepID=UPI0022DFEDAA|nr:hypothetical protein [Hungatella effluvii]
MRKELYSMKCPGRIVFGDPLYFEDYKGERLADLVVTLSLQQILVQGFLWRKRN